MPSDAAKIAQDLPGSNPPVAEVASTDGRSRAVARERFCDSIDHRGNLHHPVADSGERILRGAEIAIVAARRGRLQKQAEEGDRAARVALELGSNPNRFLSTVQVGITVISTFAAAFGGAHLATYLGEQLETSRRIPGSRDTRMARA